LVLNVPGPGANDEGNGEAMENGKHSAMESVADFLQGVHFRIYPRVWF